MATEEVLVEAVGEEVVRVSTRVSTQVSTQVMVGVGADMEATSVGVAAVMALAAVVAGMAMPSSDTMTTAMVIVLLAVGVILTVADLVVVVMVGVSVGSANLPPQPIMPQAATFSAAAPQPQFGGAAPQQQIGGAAPQQARQQAAPHAGSQHGGGGAPVMHDGQQGGQSAGAASNLATGGRAPADPTTTEMEVDTVSGGIQDQNNMAVPQASALKGNDMPESSEKGAQKGKGKPYCNRCRTKGHTIHECTTISQL